MSITSLISPSGEVGVQDSLWHIAYSDNSGQTDFKYVFDVYRGNTQLVRVKLFPDPTTGRGYFDAAPVVRNEFSVSWFEPTGTGVFIKQPSASGEISLTYNIRAGEDFSGLTTLNLASGNVTAYNWRPPLFNRKQSTTSVYANNYMTNRKKVGKIGIGEHLYIPYKGSGTIRMNYQTYNGNNTLVASGNSSTYSASGYVQLDIGTAAVNTSAGSSVVTSATNYYKVRIENQTTSQFSEWFTVYVDCDHRYTPYCLHFVNQYGMYETMRFSKASKLSMNIERKTYEKLPERFTNTQVTYYDTNNVYHETKINYASKFNWMYKLTSDLLIDQDYVWLSELVTAPIIYFEYENDFYPVTISATSYDYVVQKIDSLKPLIVDIELNQKRNGFQR